MHLRTLPFTAILALAFTFSGCASDHYDDYEYAPTYTPGGPAYNPGNVNKKVVFERKKAPVTPVKLPNLVVGRMNWIVEGGQAHFRFKVRNEGDAPAGAFSIVALVSSSTNPDAAPLRFTQRNEEPIPARAQQDVYMAVINETAFTSDTTITVDPPTESAPGGAIWESNETDNTDSERWSCDAQSCAPLQP